MTAIHFVYLLFHIATKQAVNFVVGISKQRVESIELERAQHDRVLLRLLLSDMMALALSDSYSHQH